MNIYDIAKEAGVSISTVSRVINKKANITPEMRAKVEPVLKKYNYKPNEIARGLVANSMKTIAVITTDVRVLHYAKTVYSIEQQFSELGYNVIVCNTSGNVKKGKIYLEMLSKRSVDGVILVGSIFNELSEGQFTQDWIKRIPIVNANGKLDLPNSYSVLVDDVLGVKLAVENLKQAGHKNILYVKDLDTESANLKVKGYLEGMGNAKQDDIITTTHGIEGGKEAIKRIIAAKRTFSAIVFGEDLTAIGGMKQLQESGYRIPEDVAVIGYNNLDYVYACTPELSSVDNKVEVVANLCVKLLSDLIEKKENSGNISVQPELVVRESSKFHVI